MGLGEKISSDLKAAMKSGDKTRLETLRTLRVVLTQKEIEKRGGGQHMSAEDEISVLITAAKKRKESMELFEKGGRAELVEQEGRELAIIQEYVPKQMSPEDAVKVIDELVTETSAGSPSDFGKVMPLVINRVKGQADGRLVQELVKKRLAPTS